MDTLEFNVYEDFEQALADRFAAFMAGLQSPCTVLIDIESCGGYTEVIKGMEALISLKKTEGFVFFTNVDTFAYSCGMLLYLLGDVKTCSDSASFLYHSSGMFLADRITATDAREILEILQDDDIFTERILAENTTVAPAMLEILKKNDNFLSKEDLIYLGFMEREYELI